MPDPVIVRWMDKDKPVALVGTETIPATFTAGGALAGGATAPPNKDVHITPALLLAYFLTQLLGSQVPYDNGTSGLTAENMQAAMDEVAGLVAALDLSGLAPLNSPDFTGNPKVPTQAPGTNNTNVASTAFVTAAIAAAVAQLLNSAPGALDTLNELATALGNDANFSTTVTNALATINSTLSTNTTNITNLTARVNTSIHTNITSGATTPTGETDLVRLPALTAALTINNPSSAMADGEGMVFDLIDDGTARALTWGSKYASRMVTLPTTTVAGKRYRIGFEYNQADDKLYCMFAETAP